MTPIRVFNEVMTNTDSRKAAMLARLTNADLLEQAIALADRTDLTNAERITFAWMMSEFCKRAGLVLDNARYRTEAPVMGAVGAMVAQLADDVLQEMDLAPMAA